MTQSTEQVGIFALFKTLVTQIRFVAIPSTSDKLNIGISYPYKKETYPIDLAGVALSEMEKRSDEIRAAIRDPKEAGCILGLLLVWSEAGYGVNVISRELSNLIRSAITILEDVLGKDFHNGVALGVASGFTGQAERISEHRELLALKLLFPLLGKDERTSNFANLTKEYLQTHLPYTLMEHIRDGRTELTALANEFSVWSRLRTDHLFSTLKIYAHNADVPTAQAIYNELRGRITRGNCNELLEAIKTAQNQATMDRNTLTAEALGEIHRELSQRLTFGNRWAMGGVNKRDKTTIATPTRQ